MAEGRGGKEKEKGKDNRQILTTAGAFFSSRSFSANKAPNPMISIKDFGILGLPLSAPEARRLIAASVTPFGMGERTVLEVDASKVSNIALSSLVGYNSEHAYRPGTIRQLRMGLLDETSGHSPYMQQFGCGH